MLGTIVNCIAVLVGCIVGFLFKKGIPERIGNTVMHGLALCVLYIGISGVFEGENIIISILSIALGSIIGELLKLDERLNTLGKKLENRLKSKTGNTPVADGFITATLLFCVGAMAIVGSIQDGISGQHDTLFAKSLMDGISSIVLTASLGIGVIFSVIPVLLYQGGITLCSQFLSGVLTEPIIAEMTASGSLLIIGLAFNMLGVTKLKIMNYIPAIFIPVILCQFM